MIEKVTVFTFCKWSSYGFVLQAYAVRLFLNEMGVNSTLLPNIKQKQYVLPEYITRKQLFLKTVVFSFLNLNFERNLNELSLNNKSKIKTIDFRTKIKRKCNK